MITILSILLGQIPTSIRPPAIARAVGITAGLTTIDQFERRYGKGLVQTGGHSGGARTWYDQTTKTLIGADGFNFSDQGEIIDGFTIDWVAATTVRKVIPRIRLPKRDLGILSVVHVGMTRSQVETVLKTKLVKDSIRRSGLIKYSSEPINKANNRYSIWDAKFLFEKNHLYSINISCD